MTNPNSPDPMPTTYSVSIPSDAATLYGDLSVPERAYGAVVFAHGSGSGRHSPRNQQVARALQQDGLATLLMDLLTADEEREDLRTAEFRFDIELLGERVVRACDWLIEN